MRPTPDELIAGIRAMLRDAGTELKSAHAKAQMRRVMYILRDGRWSDAGFDLLNENEMLAGMLNALAPDDELHTENGLPKNFAEANAQNSVLRRAVAARLEDLKRSDLTATSSLRRDLALRFLERP